MTIPQTFQVFAPSLYQTFTAAEYLNYTKQTLEGFLKIQSIIENTYFIAPAILAFTVTLSIILEDKNHVGQDESFLYKLCNVVGGFALAYILASSFYFLLVQYGTIPLLEGRVTWLQTGLAGS